MTRKPQSAHVGLKAEAQAPILVAAGLGCCCLRRLALHKVHRAWMCMPPDQLVLNVPCPPCREPSQLGMCEPCEKSTAGRLVGVQLRRMPATRDQTRGGRGRQPGLGGTRTCLG
eukprot:357274-Chlamydomonas_euryale.AAC.7